MSWRSSTQHRESTSGEPRPHPESAHPSRLLRWTEGILEGGTLGLLVLAPWLFGSVEPWAQAAVFSATALLFAVWLIRASATGRPLQLPPGWIPAVCFLGWVGFQVMPIPSGLVAFLSPERLRLEQQAAHLLGISSPKWFALSVDPQLTRRYAWEFAGIGLYALLLWNIVSDGRLLRRLLLVVLAAGAALTLFGIIQRATWNGLLYWVRPIHGGDPFGPYVNRSHMGGLLLLIILLGLGYLSARSARRENGQRFDWRTWVRLPPEELFERLLLPLLLLIMAAGVLTSKSRGAMVSLLLALFLMALWFASQGREERRGLLGIAGFFVAGLLAALWIAADLFLGATERLGGEALALDQSPRLALWPEALELWRRFAWTGTGLGTFEVAFVLVRTVFPGNNAVTHAESNYIQLLCDTGVVGLGLVFWLILALLTAGSRSLARAEGRRRKRLVLGGLVAVISACLQGIANFDLSIMANWLYVVAAIVVMGKASEVGKGSSAASSLSDFPFPSGIW
ncbi:MAG: O-antigen ligase family protein [Methylacidiphilaceae bacterium]|nr:O-antigen ligase family protein [Candidatus Methylacidiphilaceae bacterium]